jgi:hypothetical protein
MPILEEEAQRSPIVKVEMLLFLEVLLKALAVTEKVVGVPEKVAGVPQQQQAKLVFLQLPPL